MRVLGQSTIASDAPYLHLGYLSAMTVTSVSKVELGAGLFCAIVAAFLSRRIRTVGPLKRAAKLLGLSALLFVGFTLVVMSCRWGRGHPDAVTHMVVSLRTRAWAQAVRAGAAAMDAAVLARGRDGWNRATRVKVRIRASRSELTITSPGPNGVFGDADDIADSALVTPEGVFFRTKEKEPQPIRLR
jgi:hypothetical protein